MVWRSCAGWILVFSAAANAVGSTSHPENDVSGRVGAFLKPSVTDVYELGVKSILFGNRLRLDAATFALPPVDQQL
jgi:outer membrane receptor for monomeric catechols